MDRPQHMKSFSIATSDQHVSSSVVTDGVIKLVPANAVPVGGDRRAEGHLILLLLVHPSLQREARESGDQQRCHGGDR